VIRDKRNDFESIYFEMVNSAFPILTPRANARMLCTVTLPGANNNVKLSVGGAGVSSILIIGLVLIGLLIEAGCGPPI
jgi:hypothetical protein